MKSQLIAALGIGAVIANALGAAASPARALSQIARPAVTALSSIACPTNTHARLAHAVLVDEPEIARKEGRKGSVTVRVDLSSSGTLLASSIAASSQIAWLDRAALDAVRGSSFAPETRDCRQIAGSYLVEVEIASD